MPDRCTDPTCEQHWPAEWPTAESLVAADPDRALEFSDQLARLVMPIRTAKRKAAEQAQRDAGQVWWAIYDRYHVRHRDEYFSFEDAQSFLTYGADYGTLAAVGVELPDGTITTDWEAPGE
jgi:hypothetical protein